jgi:cytochrome P450
VLRDKPEGFRGQYGAPLRRLGRHERAGHRQPARTMLVLDPPDYALRSLVTKAFTARRVADMRPRIKALVDERSTG